MSKVFRYHQGRNNIKGWGISVKYNNSVYGNDPESIKDPAGATASKEITSIPSPFARIDLIKAAFGFVNTMGLDGRTIHHKMVSHALDVAQMFFNYDTFKNAKLLDMIKWDKSNVQVLKNSQNPQERLFGRTLDLFLNQDATTYNFGEMKSIFMLRYVGPGSPKQFNIIGATSPATLFFTSANDNSCVSNYIKFGTHKALDPDVFVKLSKRDANFIKYMYDLRASIPDFALKFMEVDEYLNNSFGELPYELQQYVNAVAQGTQISANYDELDYMSGVPVEVLGFPLGKLRPVDIGAVSDFALDTSKQLNRIPLALPCGAFSRAWRYTTSIWNSDIQVPVCDNRKIGARTLPQDNTAWPYLTMDDFLEKNIIEMDSEGVSSDFFYGNMTDDSGISHSFLLPIKQTYFDYFSVNELKKALRMECHSSDGVGMRVKVSLDIPVKAGIVTYERNYMVQATDGDMMNPKDGAIIPMSFTMTLFPCVKFPIGTKPDYRLTLLTLEDDYQMELSCVKEGDSKALLIAKMDRNINSSGGREEILAPNQPMYAVEENFEFITLNINGYDAVIVPEWRGNAGGSTYEFAVDFGTTNTHIEYKVGAGASKSLDITDEHIQMSCLNVDALKNTNILPSIRNNQIPYKLGIDIKFPMRTLLSYKTATNWNQPFWPYITGNMPFYYGSVVNNKFNSLESDLKWSSPDQMVKCYLASIMLLIRNKVLMEGGNLPSTRIVWFYPTSMSMNQLNIISNIWNQLYSYYIGPNANTLLSSIPESIAPYTYYQGKFGAGVNVLTIDIGGGTSDAYIVDNNAKPAFITSFRFAANSLFGDAFKRAGADTNGFVKKFKPMMEQALNANGLAVVTNVLSEVERSQISADYISLLFTLKENSDVILKGCQDNLDFMKMLQKEEGAKTLMLIFYAAIIYHMAVFIKAKINEGNSNVREPEFIAFSGNGSKLLNILGVDTPVGATMLSEYTKKMFEKVMDSDYPDHGIKVITDPLHPKEATSKGGLLLNTIPSPIQIRNMSATLLGTKDARFVGTEQYDNLTDDDFEKVKDAVNDFTQKFYELAQEMNLSDAFGIMTYADLLNYKQYFTSNTVNRTRNALNFYNKLNAKTPIENTLFFYPITQLLNELAPLVL